MTLNEVDACKSGEIQMLNAAIPFHTQPYG